MIENRNSNDYLHTDVILQKITDYDIFRYYCPNFKELGKKFTSDLREDKSPSVSIVKWNNKLLYKDFGHPDHTFDCFSYVRAKFNCEFYSALRIIDTDFNLKLSTRNDEIAFTMGYIGYSINKPIYEKKETIVQKRKRNWNYADEKYWSKYLISKKILSTFGVEPITHYWINGNRFTCKSITYAYRFGNKYKIYAPYEKDGKWVSNTDKKIIQGYNQLPEKGNICIITSSLKDVMCLFKMGIPSVALQSEMQMPEETLIKTLQKRFKEIRIFYDNDFTNLNNPGQTMAIKICNKYNFIKNIYLPETYKVKDISDYIEKFQSTTKIQTLINNTL